MKTPILLLVFNRPIETAKVLAVIKAVQPEKIFVAADGPRLNRPDDIEKCLLVKKIIEKEIDWPCEKYFLFRENNLGCRQAVSSAIDWFFSQVEEGIILEDDCLPNETFFNFCQELLQKYRDNDKVMHISGNNFLSNKFKLPADYYFSRIPHIWGWATWRRAWKKYDVSMSDWPEVKGSDMLKNTFKNQNFSQGWTNIFDQIYAQKINTWDYQWTYAILKNTGYCINPRVNLVSNIGFTADATHTASNNKFSNLPTSRLDIKTHPLSIKYNLSADNYILKNNFGFSSTQKITDAYYQFRNRLIQLLINLKNGISK